MQGKNTNPWLFVFLIQTCDSVFWEINQNTLKPQSPVDDLCIFFTTRLPHGANTFIVSLTAFPSRYVFCHMSHPRIHPRTEERCRFRSKRAEVSCGCFFVFLAPKPLKVGDLVPGHALCIAWYTNSTQRHFFFSREDDPAVAHQ